MRALSIVAVACVAAAASPASASPLGDPAIERAVFGGSTAAQPSSLLINPAALSLGIDGWHVHVDGSSTLDWVAVDRRLVDPDTGELIAGPDTRTVDWSPGGHAGFYKVGRRFSAGFQFALPGADQLVDGGDDLAYHSMGGQHRELAWLVAGGAYRWRGLAFGATFKIIKSELDLRFARDTALESGRNTDRGTLSDCDGQRCGFEHPAARELYRIEADTTWLPSADTIAVSFGAVARITEGWWIGMSGHLPQGTFGSAVTASGTVDVELAPRDGGAHLDGETTVRFALPTRLRIGGRGRITDELDVVGELSWDDTSTMSQYDVRLYGLDLADAGIPEMYPRPRGLRDQVSVQAGVEQIDIGQRWLVGGRLGFQRGATAPDRMSALQVYPASVIADVGVQLRLAPSWVVQVGYGVSWAPSSDSGRGAYDPIARLDCIDSGFDIDTDACRAVRAGYGLPTASGVYQRIDNVFRLGLRYDVP